MSDVWSLMANVKYNLYFYRRNMTKEDKDLLLRLLQRHKELGRTTAWPVLSVSNLTADIAEYHYIGADIGQTSCLACAYFAFLWNQPSRRWTENGERFRQNGERLAICMGNVLALAVQGAYIFGYGYSCNHVTFSVFSDYYLIPIKYWILICCIVI